MFIKCTGYTTSYMWYNMLRHTLHTLHILTDCNTVVITLLINCCIIIWIEIKYIIYIYYGTISVTIIYINKHDS